MERTAEENKIASEIELLEAEARLCYYFAKACPAHKQALTARAKKAETGAANARLFLSGRLILQGAQLEQEIEESRR